MLLYYVITLSVCFSGLCGEESVETEGTLQTATDDVTEEAFPVVTDPQTEDVTVADLPEALPDGNVTLEATGVAPGAARRRPRRRGRRQRFFNDNQFRNPYNNPYNPNSPYSFRGRPGQPPINEGYYDRRYRTGYDAQQYYNPYQQGYYGYPAYPQSGYYPQYYPPQPPGPYPSPAPTDPVPELYYVQKAEGQDGQYQYKKVSVLPDTSGGRRRGTRRYQGSTGYKPQQGYYGYSDPYNRREPTPQQPYYSPQAYQYPQQYPQNPQHYPQNQQQYPQNPQPYPQNTQQYPQSPQQSPQTQQQYPQQPYQQQHYPQQQGYPQHWQYPQYSPRLPQGPRPRPWGPRPTYNWRLTLAPSVSPPIEHTPSGD